MKKTIVFFYLCIAIAFVSLAQQPQDTLAVQSTISGTVIDQKTKEPLPFVNIFLYKGERSNQIGWAQTGEQGHFKISVLAPKGDYSLFTSLVGYVRDTIQHISLPSKEFSNISIALKESKSPQSVVIYYYPLIDSSIPTKEFSNISIALKESKIHETPIKDIFIHSYNLPLGTTIITFDNFSGNSFKSIQSFSTCKY